MGRLIDLPDDYEQGHADGVRAAEEAAMSVFAILVRRLGGKVEIGEDEAVREDPHNLYWYFDPLKMTTVYEVRDGQDAKAS